MSYWEDRQRQLNKALDKDEEKLRKRLAKLYDKEAARLEKEIARYYQLYGEENVIEYRKLMEALPESDRVLLIEDMDEFAAKHPEYSHLLPVRESIYKLDRLQGLQYSIQLQQLEIGAEEIGMITEHLEKVAERSLSTAAQAMGFGTSFYSMNKDIVKNFVNVPWSNGQKFSDSIWDNKSKLARYLNQDFAQGVARGDSYERLIKSIRERFGKVSRNDAYRLIYTEGTFVQAEASIQPFTEDFERYRVSTVGDGKVCPICSNIAEQTFNIEDRTAGVNFPPFHPWCRCTFIVVVDDRSKWVDDYVERHGDGSAKQAEKILDKVADEKKKSPADVTKLDEAMKKSIYDYTNGDYDDVCRYSQYLVDPDGLMHGARQFENAILPYISDRDKERAEELLRLIGEQSEKEQTLFRLEIGVNSSGVGDTIKMGIRSTTRDDAFVDKVFDSNMEGFDFESKNFNGEWTEYRFENVNSLDISPLSAYKSQEEELVSGAFEVTKVEFIENIPRGLAEKTIYVKDYAENVEHFVSKKGKDMVRYTYKGKEYTDTPEKFNSRTETEYVNEKGQFGRKIIWLKKKM